MSAKIVKKEPMIRDAKFALEPEDFRGLQENAKVTRRSSSDLLGDSPEHQANNIENNDTSQIQLIHQQDPVVLSHEQQVDENKNHETHEGMTDVERLQKQLSGLVKKDSLEGYPCFEVQQYVIDGQEINKEGLWLYRPGTDGKEIMNMRTFDRSATLYSLQSDHSWSAPIQRYAKLQILGLSDDRSAYELVSESLLETKYEYEGKITPQFLTQVRPFSNEVAYFTEPTEDGKKFLMLHLIPEGQSVAIDYEIRRSSEKFKLHRLTQVVRDRDNRLLIVFIEGTDIYFYDVELDRAILRVQNAVKLLYISVDQSGNQFCLFQNFGCYLDFATARNNSESVEVDPNQELNQGVKSSFWHNFDKDVANNVLAFDWKRNGTQGFVTYCNVVQRLHFAEVQFPSKIKVLETRLIEKNDHRLTIQKWISQGLEFPIEQRDDQMQSLFRLIGDLVVYTYVEESRTVILSDLVSERSFGLYFKDRIVTVCRPLIPTLPGAKSKLNQKPSFIVFTHNRENQKFYITTVEYTPNTNGFSINDLVARTHACNAEYSKELAKVGTGEGLKNMENFEASSHDFCDHDCTFEYFGGSDLRFYIQTQNKLTTVFGESVRHNYDVTHIKLFHYGHTLFFSRNTSGEQLTLNHPEGCDVVYRFPGCKIIQSTVVNGILHVLDSNLNLGKYRFDLKPGSNVPQIVSGEQISLQHFNELKSELQAKSFWGSQMSDSCIRFRDKIISLKTGRILDYCQGCCVIVTPHKIFYKIQNEVITIYNPESRRVDLGSILSHCRIRKLHQVSPQVLLVEQGDELEQEWCMLDIDGTRSDVPLDLKQALDTKCDVQSSMSSNGLCQLIVCIRSTANQDSCIKSARVLELCLNGEIARQNLLNIVPRAEDTSPVAKDEIMKNYEGELLQVRVLSFAQDVSEPQLLFFNKSAGNLSCIQFEHANQNTAMAFAGEYFCWINKHCLHTLNLKTKATNMLDLSSIYKYQIYEEEDEERFCDLEACDPPSMIEAGMLGKVDRHGLQRLADHVQVSYQTRSRIYSLRGENIVAVRETHLLTQALLDPDQYVQSDGFRGFYRKLNQDEVHGVGIKFRDYTQYSLSTSPFRNLIIEEINGRQMQVYQKFASQDLHHMRAFREMTQDFPIKILWATFLNDSLVGHLIQEPDHYKLFLGRLESEDLSYGDQHRIALMLSRRQLRFDEQAQKFRATTIVQDVISNPNVRDSLLKIGKVSGRLFSFTQSQVDDQEYMERYIEYITPTIIESLNLSINRGIHGVYEIGKMLVPPDFTHSVHMVDSLDVTDEQLQNLIKEEQGVEEPDLKKELIVELLDLRWLFAGRKNFTAAAFILDDMPARFFSSRFCITILDHFWDEVKWKMFWRQFVPFIIEVILAVAYFKLALSDENYELKQNQEWPAERIVEKVIGVVALILLFVSFWIEVAQIKNEENKCDYFSIVWNWIDLCGLFLTLVIFVLTLVEINWLEVETMRVIASLASCSLLIKLYDWLKLFEKPGFYIRLIETTLRDVIAFLLLFLIALMIFGIPLSILDMNRSEGNELIGSVFGFWLLDAIYNQYLLSLGEFGGILETAQLGAQEKLVILIFWVTTFFTMLTMLNMLIAIMGDSFAEATENAERYSVMTRFEILSNLAVTLPQTTYSEERNVFMIIVSVVKDEDDQDDAWQGSINKVAALTKRSIRSLEQELKKNMNEQQTTILGAVSSKTHDIESKVKENQASIQGMERKVDQIEAAQNQTNSNIEEMKSLLNKLIKAQGIK